MGAERQGPDINDYLSQRPENTEVSNPDLPNPDSKVYKAALNNPRVSQMTPEEQKKELSDPNSPVWGSEADRLHSDVTWDIPVKIDGKIQVFKIPEEIRLKANALQNGPDNNYNTVLGLTTLKNDVIKYVQKIAIQQGQSNDKLKTEEEFPGNPLEGVR